MCFRLIPPPNFLCLLRTPRMVFLEGFQDSKRKQPPRGHEEGTSKGRTKSPRVDIPGVRGVTPCLPGGRTRISGQIRGRKVLELGAEPKPPEERRKTSDAETRGSPYAALEPPALGRPGQGQDTAASAPEPCPAPAPAPADGHRDLAPPGHPLCRLRTGSARGVPARHLRLSPAARSHHT